MDVAATMRSAADAEQLTRSPRVGLKRVVIGTDLTLHGDRAVRRAATLPYLPRAGVTVAHALPARLDRSAAAVIEGAVETELEAAASKLARWLAARGRTDVTITTRVTRGSPSERLDRLAGRVGADLIVVGRRGQSRIRELLLGTTARRLIRHGRHPVLVVAGAPTTPYRRALVGIDFSAAAWRAARTAQRLLLRAAALTAVHAYDDPLREPPGLRPRERGLARLELRDRARRIRRALEPLVGNGTRWSLVVKEGDPRRVLLEAGRRKKADLIAVGSAGRSGVDRVLVGSVAETVIEHARCDVLVVVDR
jgi:nucleotide-binding universal stress UspA family protein